MNALWSERIIAELKDPQLFDWFLSGLELAYRSRLLTAGILEPK